MGRKRSRTPAGQRDRRKSTKYTHIGRVTVYQRGQQWYIYYREDGRERRLKIGTDKRLAEQRAAEVNGQLACGMRSSFQYERIGLSDLVDRWLEHHELIQRSSMRTVSRYRAAIAHLLRFAADRHPSMTIDALTVPIAEEFVKFLRTVPISPNGLTQTKKRRMRDRGVLGVLRTGRALWNYASKHRHVLPYSTNPFTELKIESMRIDDMKPKYILSPEDEAKFFAACRPWEFRVFFTLAFTGMRPGELVHLLIDDVNFETRTVSIRNHHELGWRTKTRGERRVYLFDELLAIVRQAVGHRTCGPAFLSFRFDAGKAVPNLAGMDTPALAKELARRIEVATAKTPDVSQRKIEAREADRLWRDAGAIKLDTIRQHFMRTAAKIGMPHMTAPYAFRHGMATAMQAADVDPFVRTKIIGHTTLTTTAIYTHTADLTLARGMKQAAELRPDSLKLARERAGLPPTPDGGGRVLRRASEEP